MRFDYDYVIVGGGMAADSAARGIRETDPDGSIAVLGEDTDEPYERPPLTKDLWRESPAPDADTTDLGTATATGADVRTSTRVTAIDTDRHVVVANDDDEYGYRALLVATGGRPRELDVPPGPRVVYFRTRGDYHRARALADEARSAAGDPAGRVLVVGGGFVGTELAAGLATAGAPVTYLTSSAAVGAATYPEVLTRRIESRYAEHGVEVLTRARVTRLELEGADRVVVHADVDGSPVTLSGLGVLVGFGIEPNVELAAAAGLASDPDLGGLVVDAHLRTSDRDVFAAGDVAAYPDALLGRRRVEHVDQAQQSGHAAGRNLAAHRLGRDLETYEHTPFFYSDIFDLGYEAVGVLDAGLDLVEDWAPGGEGETGVVYYVAPAGDEAAGALRGVLLWNVWDSTDKARALLAELGAPGAVTDPGALRGRIPTT